MRKLQNRELNRLDIEGFKATEKIPLTIVLDNIRSLNNIGSVFRTADAFLIDRIILCGITAVPPNKEIHKTALGATESVDWTYADQTLEAVRELKAKGVHILSVEQAEDSTNLKDFIPEKGLKYAVVFGNEVKGVQQQVVEKNLYVAGVLAGWRSQFAMAAGSGAHVATDILTLWNGGNTAMVHDSVPKNK